MDTHTRGGGTSGAPAGVTEAVCQVVASTRFHPSGEGLRDTLLTTEVHERLCEACKLAHTEPHSPRPQGSAYDRNKHRIHTHTRFIFYLCACILSIVVLIKGMHSPAQTLFWYLLNKCDIYIIMQVKTLPTLGFVFLGIKINHGLEALFAWAAIAMYLCKLHAYNVLDSVWNTCTFEETLTDNLT